MLTALAFAIWPLARAREIQPAALFRDLIAPVRRFPRWQFILAAGAALLGLAVLCLATTHDRRFALYFMMGAAGAFPDPARGGIRPHRIHAPIAHGRQPILRLAFANIHRPGAAISAIMLSLGLGLSAAGHGRRAPKQLCRRRQQQIGGARAQFLFVDIQNDQLAPFKDAAAKIAPTAVLSTTPSYGPVPASMGCWRTMSTVSKAVAGIFARRSRRHLFGDAAVRHGDHGRTILGSPDYRGAPLITFDADLASAFHIGIGATLTVNVLPRRREVTGTIACLRHVD